MSSVNNIKSLSDIVEQYEAFILDQWGVMHDGFKGYPDAISCIKKLIELDTLKGSTNESEISIANAYYEVEGTGTVKLEFDNEKKLEMTSIDNYGLKPSEEKIKGTGDIKITTDANVDKFSLMLECHKETGFSNG